MENKKAHMPKIKKKLLEIILAGVLLITPITSCDWFPLPKDNHYPGVVVFTYDEEEIPKNITEQIKNELTVSDYYPEINSMSIQDWYQREAKKYREEIDIPIDFYPEQIKVLEKFITLDIDECYNAGTRLGYPIDLLRFSPYLRKTYPELKDYDFLAIIYSEDRYNGVYAIEATKSFLLYSSSKERDFIANDFAHEFAHLLGATDKKEFPDTMDPMTDEEVDRLDIMRNGSYVKDELLNDEYLRYKHTGALLEEVVITPPTAREIGWLE